MDAVALVVSVALKPKTAAKNQWKNQLHRFLSRKNRDVKTEHGKNQGYKTFWVDCVFSWHETQNTHNALVGDIRPQQKHISLQNTLLRISCEPPCNWLLHFIVPILLRGICHSWNLYLIFEPKKYYMFTVIIKVAPEQIENSKSNCQQIECWKILQIEYYVQLCENKN